MKKLAAAIAIILVIGGIVFLGFYLRSRNESATPPTTADPGNLPAVQLPKTTGDTRGDTQSAGQTAGLIENLTVAANVPAVDYFVDAKNTVTVVQPDGQILKTGGSTSLTTGGGQPESLSASIVKNIMRVSFSFDGKKILVTMRGPSENQTSIFDAVQKTWQPLPQNANGPVWSPDNYQVAYFSGASGADGSILSLLDAGGSTSTKPKVLLALHQEDMKLDWLSPSRILIADKTSVLSNSSVWSFDPVKKIISPVVQDQPGLETIWSSSPAQFGLMFSANQNQEGGLLRLVDASGKGLKQLNFLTLPSKCVFYDKLVSAPTQPFDAAPSTSFDIAQDKSLGTSQDKPASSTAKVSTNALPSSSSTPADSGNPTSPTKSEVLKSRTMLICAVPRDQRALSVNALPDAYQEKALFTSDDFFEINVNDGNVKTLFSDPAKTLDVSNIKIFNQNIFFINRFDKKVYSLPLGE
ncbi:MAG: hypothetical protein HY433_00670 [Candidatus Liptonbacteria bacterium]|nr:hypothetical protein [Candidatus Liptonbacteria bacterium]